MHNNAGVCNQIIGLSRGWPADVMTGKEFRDAMLPLSLGYDYLNPAGEYTWFPVQEKAEWVALKSALPPGQK